jgi:hypothetical protein
MRETQRQWAERKLRTSGYVSRNEALRTYITRLGAIICDLRKDGWDITGRWQKQTNGGKDYIYFLNRKEK